MTMPEYRRAQCTIWVPHWGPQVVQLWKPQAEILSTLLARYPLPVSMKELIEEVYPDPWTQPDDAENCIAVHMSRLRKLIGPVLVQPMKKYWQLVF